MLKEYDYYNLLNKVYKRDTVSTAQLGEILNRSVISLKKDRANGTGIVYTQDSSMQVRYKLSDVVDFLESTSNTTTSGTSNKELSFNYLYFTYDTCLLSIEQTGEATLRTVEELKYDRLHKKGIPFVKMGSSKNAITRYALHDVTNFIFRDSKEIK